MGDSMLLGLLRGMLPVPGGLWRRNLAKDARRLEALLGFMSPEHHQVRNFAVLELPRRGAPLAPGQIASELGLPLTRVEAILGDLERRMFFLARDQAGEVTWAYPVTVDQTPHHLTFASGQQAYAA